MGRGLFGGGGTSGSSFCVHRGMGSLWDMRIFCLRYSVQVVPRARMGYRRVAAARPILQDTGKADEGQGVEGVASTGQAATSGGVPVTDAPRNHCVFLV